MRDALTSFLHTRQVIVHLGAHKTATTYIQSRLKESRNALKSNGVAVVLPGDVRSTGVLGRSRPRRAAADRDGGDENTGPDLDGLLNGIAADPVTRRIVISEESIVGAPRINLSTRSLYPDLIRKCRRLPVALNHPNVTFLYAVRDYGSFFSSNITTAVRRGNVFEPEALRPAFLALHRNWIDVISDIRRAFPAVTLKLWRYEDFEKLEAQVFSQFDDGFAPPPSRRVFKTLSRNAMRHILDRVDPTKDPRELRPIIRAAAQRFPVSASNPPYSLWSAEEAAHLTHIYDLHWQEIRETFAGSILT